MDFLCVRCDTILRMCHYMSNITMVVMGTTEKSPNVHFFCIFLFVSRVWALTAWLSFSSECNSFTAFYDCCMLSVLNCCFILVHRTPPLITLHYFSNNPTSVPAGVCGWSETSIIDWTARKLCKTNTNDCSDVKINVLMLCCSWTQPTEDAGRASSPPKCCSTLQCHIGRCIWAFWEDYSTTDDTEKGQWLLNWTVKVLTSIF